MARVKFNDFIEALNATKPGGVVEEVEGYQVALSTVGEPRKCWTKVLYMAFYVDENDLENK